MSARKKEEINLLPQKGFASSTTGRILAWILSTFRIIVIATEIIVMIAFLSRFWLDAQNTDLADEISDKKAVIEASLPFEKEFKDTQKRLSIFSQLALIDNPLSEILDATADYLPSDVILSTATFNDEGAEISGLTTNEKGIQQYVVNLQTIEDFKQVNLVEIRSQRQNSSFLEYTIKTKYKI